MHTGLFSVPQKHPGNFQLKLIMLIMIHTVCLDPPSPTPSQGTHHCSDLCPNGGPQEAFADHPVERQHFFLPGDAIPFPALFSFTKRITI